MEKYRSALLQRYPVGLLEDVEVHALLMSWSKPSPIRSFMESELISLPWIDSELESARCARGTRQPWAAPRTLSYEE